MKKHYEPLCIECIGLDSAQGILSGSVSTVSIAVSNNVQVEDFQSGFGASAEDIEAGRDFKTIDFD